jgi:riboflavin kinase/FMN adenylyltransferase
MPVREDLSKLSPARDTALAIGVFDGVHRGHQYLLTRLNETARHQHLLSGVVTFDPHPQELLSPDYQPAFLTTPGQRAILLQAAGVDFVTVLKFTPELANLSAREFVGLLREYLRLKQLVIGADFTLGHNREGNAAFLKELGQEMNFTVTEVRPQTQNGDTVISSSAIRRALAAGDVGKAQRFIGRPFSLEGRVGRGAGRGTGLSFPTANLEIDPRQAVPAAGVYASRAYIADAPYPAMTYIGRCPTFGGDKPVVEVYILDYQDDLYGQGLKVDIIERIRGEVTFATPEDLKKQIARDVAEGKAILERDAAVG